MLKNRVTKLTLFVLMMLSLTGCSTGQNEVNAKQKVDQNYENEINDNLLENEEENDEIHEEVEPVIETGITVEIQDMKCEYWIDEDIIYDGLKVILNYSDGTEKELSSEEYIISEIDTSTYGAKEVFIKYNDFEESFYINVIFTVTECEEKTMYSKTSLNVRTGPATTFESIGVLSLNQEIKVNGVCDNGWSQVSYKDQIAYVSTKYLSDKKIEVQKATSNYSDTAKVAAEMASRQGMIGRLYIPAVGVNVALFNSFSQATVDAKDSAGTWRGTNMVIADHKTQGFSAMKSSVVGSTIAYINNGSSVAAYMCVEKSTGRNNETSLVDGNGASLYTKIPGGLVMYTCNDHWSDITYTCWSPI